MSDLKCIRPVILTGERPNILLSPVVNVLDAMLDVQGCSKVTVKVNGSDARNSNRYSSLPVSAREEI